MNIRHALKSEYPDVKKHYELCGYRGGVQDNDTVVIALEDQSIIGAVRICNENGEKVLRGMYVRVQFRNSGVGKTMLQFLNDKMGLDNCYCLPYAHLKSFYGQIGFREIAIDYAPIFLSERLNTYATVNPGPIIIMKKDNKAIHP